MTTTLPTSDQFNAPTVTQGQFKSALTQLLAYLQQQGVEDMETIRQIVNQYVLSDPVAINSGIVAAIWDELSGKYAPFMNNFGRLLTSDAAGNVLDVAGRGELLMQEVPFIGLINGERPYRITCDLDGRIIEVWTMEESYFYAGQDGLVRDGARNADLQRYGLSSAVSPYGDVTTVDYAKFGVICYIIVVLGQSNAFGSDNGGFDTQPSGYPSYTGQAVIASSPEYPDNNWMFAGTNPRRQYNSSVTDLVSLVESRLPDGTGGETLCSGLATHLVRDVYNATGEMINTLSFVVSEGGQPYRNLKRGSIYYDAYLQGLDDAVTACKSRGWTPVVLTHVWVQGEADSNSVSNMSVRTRQRQMQQLNRQLTADAMARTGQTDVPIFVESQVATAESTQTGDGAFVQPVRQASLEDDGLDNMRCAGPFYQFPTSGNGPNQIHANCTGQNQLGQMISRTVLNEFFGQGSKVMRCIGYRWIDSVNLLLEFDPAVSPLVLDTSGSVISTTGLGAGLGFWFDDYSGTPPTITNAQVVNNTFIQLTLSGAPAVKDCRVSYAMRATIAPMSWGGGPYGPNYGPRGCLRDSATHTNQYTSFVQQNWCPAFSMPVTYAV